ncbi:MAG: Na+/H+ antiporter NhaC [Acidobacteria bacterium]|nr:MAG: Na+/H+ antiporter NhaC [Acidobacteriota bacterium]REJ98056.1 MAG: Na+/H+ antiporter NhaC [Acidobacteriota bacterium]REK16799.1 MAG: Na+/H+ antiporter NhaC [Acidobacteriota bacterium]REK42710.1 MAG: Na+/H+ antiporter NhaC [Acidobacteriota bacterium]
MNEETPVDDQTGEPHLLVSLFPVALLLFLLIVNVIVYKDDATGGSNQLALLISGVVAAALGIFVYKIEYKKIERQIIKSISVALQASIILLVVGALIGTWIISGVVPTMIYYGLLLISPAVFLPVACVVCSIVALATGSSWSTTGTVGIALIGIGQTLGIPLGMVAGAIISGAYFGDKMSPLSDTTNLAAAMAETDVFTHIRHMMYTTGPAIILAVIGFSALGFFYGQGTVNQDDINAVLTVIDSNFSIGIHLFLVPLAVLFMVYYRIPALPALLIGAVLGAIFALIFQTELIASMAADGPSIRSYYQTIITTAYGGFVIETDNELINTLFNRGGMASMLSTVWLILMAMIFSGAMEGTGMLQRIAKSILKAVRGVGSLVGATLVSCLFMNMTAGDQYLAILVPGRMFKEAYRKYRLHPKNLSRTIEDSGTVTSVLVPWNSGGAYNSGVLGVATLTYLPFCFFNILSPIVSAFLAGFDLTIERLDDEEED